MAAFVGPSMETIVTFMNKVHGARCLNLDRLSVPDCNLSNVLFSVRVERARITRIIALFFSSLEEVDASRLKLLRFQIFWRII